MTMPENRGRRDRIFHDITDISSTKQLVSFAVAGQLERVTRQQAGLSQARIAQAAGFGNNRQSAGARLSTDLRKGLSSQNLRSLDEIIGVLAPDLEGTSLSSLALRLSGEGRAELKGSMTAHVPPSWTRQILQDPPAGDVGVLIQASALLSAFISADKLDAADSVARVRDRYLQELDGLVRRLIHISAEPPTSRNYDAQILLGILASYAFEQMRDRLEQELRSPLGFRVWRAITKLVRLSGGGEHAQALRRWVRLMVMEAEELRDRSLYAGRGLDLELAISIPYHWSQPGDDWAGRALLVRAREDKATIRERGTAVMGLWQRAITQERADRENTERDLRDLVTKFRSGESRPDAKAGLEWIAATLEHAMDARMAVCNEFPNVDQAWFQCVQETANEIDVPEHLRQGTQSLFRHMILQNAGVYRRQAVETVVTSGWNEPVARALGSLLKKLETQTDETWLRVRAEFALGLLGKQSMPVVLDDLTRACRHAFGNVQPSMDGPDGEPWRAHITEMHSSLFAVGDCFGVAGAEANARVIRDNISDILANLAEMEPGRGQVMRRAARAAAYTLTMTAQPSRPNGPPDLSRVLLEKLSRHPDEVTAGLSRWALTFRFAGDGTIRPLLDAAVPENNA
jgi:hypothetical protein